MKVPRRTGAADKVTQRAALYCASNADCSGLSGTTCNLGAADGGAATHKYVGLACTTNDQCPACQTCDDPKCIAPAADSACLVRGR